MIVFSQKALVEKTDPAHKINLKICFLCNPGHNCWNTCWNNFHLFGYHSSCTVIVSSLLSLLRDFQFIIVWHKYATLQQVTWYYQFWSTHHALSTPAECFLYYMYMYSMCVSSKIQLSPNTLCWFDCALTLIDTVQVRYNIESYFRNLKRGRFATIRDNLSCLVSYW